MRTVSEEKAAIEKLTEAIREYHSTLDSDEAPVGSVPMNWVIAYSATAIHEDDIVWGNHSVASQGDPNTHSGLAMWAAEMMSASTEDYDG